MSFRFLRRLGLVYGFVFHLAVIPSAQALDPDYRTVANAGLYGLAAGTLAGLISAPLSGNGRNIFIGTSVGLYLGLAVGLYHITHRDDPGNPLRYAQGAGSDSRWEPGSALSTTLTASPPSLVEVSFQVARF